MTSNGCVGSSPTRGTNINNLKFNKIMSLNKRPRKDLFPGNRIRIVKYSDSSFIDKEAIVTGQDKKYVYITLDMDYYFDKTNTTPREVMRIAPDCIEEI